MIEAIIADLQNPAHADALVRLIDEYACDPMGGGKGLAEAVKAQLPAALDQRSTAHVILALVDSEPAGLAVCLEGFSTFACKPLLNIHDIVVSLPYRGQGLSRLLLQKTEEIAIYLGCCKLTGRTRQDGSPRASAGGWKSDSGNFSCRQDFCTIFRCTRFC